MTRLAGLFRIQMNAADPLAEAHGFLSRRRRGARMSAYCALELVPRRRRRDGQADIAMPTRRADLLRPPSAPVVAAMTRRWHRPINIAEIGAGSAAGRCPCASRRQVVSIERYKTYDVAPSG
jgi:hypothetical protein